MTSETMTASEAILEALKPMEFTQGMDPQHLAKLAAMAMEESFAEDEMIFREGDESKLIYLVREGLVALYIRVPSRGQITILTVGPGKLLGWSSLFPPHKKTASARAVAPTRVIAISAPELWQACKTDEGLGYNLMSRVGEVITGRLIATRLQLMDIFSSTGTEQDG
jgi:CRP/FNR family cyclic AMP-dependent transcriptional regulator